MEAYLKENRAVNANILAVITDEAPSDAAKTLLSAYSVEEKTLTKILKEMLQSDADTIGQVAVYLHINDIDITSKASTRAVCKDIVRALDNAMREKCAVCDKWYNVGLDETPVTQCTDCGQGCHTQCYEEHNINLPGIYFLCSTCDNKKKSHQKTKEVKTGSQQTNNAQSPAKEPVAEEITNISRTLHLDDSVQLDDEEDEITPFQRNQSRESSPTPKKPICPKYQYSKCEDYDNCKNRYDHPPRCRDFLRKGKCSYGKKCRFHHPKLCSSSLTEWKCFNLDCRFFHLKGTVRYEDQTEDQGGQSQHHNFGTYPASLLQHSNQQTYSSAPPPSVPQHPHYPTQSHNNNQAQAVNPFLEQHMIETNNKFLKLEGLINRFISLQIQQVPKPPGNQFQPPVSYQQPQSTTQTQYMPQTAILPQPPAMQTLHMHPQLVRPQT